MVFANTSKACSTISATPRSGEVICDWLIWCQIVSFAIQMNIEWHYATLIALGDLFVLEVFIPLKGFKVLIMDIKSWGLALFLSLCVSYFMIHNLVFSILDLFMFYFVFIASCTCVLIPTVIRACLKKSQWVFSLKTFQYWYMLIGWLFLRLILYCD